VRFSANLEVHLIVGICHLRHNGYQMWVGFCQWQKGLLSFSWKLFSFSFFGLVMKDLARSSWEHIALKSARIRHLETGWRSPWKSAWCRSSRSMSNSMEYIGIPSHITGRTISSIMFWKLITPKNTNWDDDDHMMMNDCPEKPVMLFIKVFTL